MKTMHLFAGAGGGLLADLILGHEPVVAVEWDKYACRVLRERAEDGWFQDLHVWEGDIRLFNPSEYKGRVDCIHAGFPCQDISIAGNQRGVGEDTRSGLYREVIRISDEVRPEYIFLENVAAIVTGNNGEWLRTITADLAERGYNAVWCCLSASEVGAKHKRDRWWLLGYTEHNGQPSTEVGKIIEERDGSNKERKEQACQSQGSGEQFSYVADTISKGLQGWKEARNIGSKRQGRNEQSERCCDNERQARSPKSSMGRMVDDVAYRMDWNSVEAQVGRTTNETENRAARLKALGNGQVPLQAATAFSILWQMMEAANEPKQET